MDVVSHRIVTALGGAASGKTVEDKMQDANVACRKLASEHPLLILRSFLLFSIKLLHCHECSGIFMRES